ncbi:MAG: hypothetical protein NTX48_16520 [Planctomycetales bacterium]|nr:hypothetical protein [Planctomycetales bacterium]
MKTITEPESYVTHAKSPSPSWLDAESSTSSEFIVRASATICTGCRSRYSVGSDSSTRADYRISIGQPSAPRHALEARWQREV